MEQSLLTISWLVELVLARLPIRTFQVLFLDRRKFIFFGIFGLEVRNFKISQCLVIDSPY